MSGVFLDTAAVMARYGIRDARSARRIMDDAGGLVVAGRLVLALADLERWEELQKGARRQQARTAELPARAGTARRALQKAREPRREPLKPGWWREAS